MLRISVVRSSEAAVRLLLEGQVIGPWVEQLRQSCEETLSHGAQLILDLAGVSFLDDDGVTLFRTLMDRDVVLTNTSPFVTFQLKG